jgi:UDP-N-acetylmuramoylalanine--D-glutamate ligase
MNKGFFRDKRVVVMGLGSFGGGEDSALFAAKAGAKVLVTDLSGPDKLSSTLEPLKGLPIEYRLGEHREDDFRSADIIIVNPAVPPDNRFVQVAQKSKSLVTSQVELFFQMCPAPIVAVTGANGKSTTTSLTAHLLTAGIGQPGISWKSVRLSGNIGNRPLLGLLDDLSAKDRVVLELSSFQLEQLARIQKAPLAAVITNLTPNHLVRHGTSKRTAAPKKTSSNSSRSIRSIPACRSSMPKTPSLAPGLPSITPSPAASAWPSVLTMCPMRCWPRSNAPAAPTAPIWPQPWPLRRTSASLPIASPLL